MKRIGLISIVVLALAGAYLWGRANAAGVPATQPLFYAGTLTDTSGAAASGSHAFIVKLYPDMTTTNAACTFATAATVTNGRFRLQLDDTCTAAVHANPDLYLELTVDTQPFPRSKLGAVPYALESANASSVPLSGVTGISATTDWPGSVNPERVSAGVNNGFVRVNASTGGFLLGAFSDANGVLTESGSWITLTSHTAASGVYNFALSGYTAGNAPACVVTPALPLVDIAVTNAAYNALQVKTNNPSGSVTDSPFFILCLGR
jgi:hypothetical protein